MSSSGPLRRVTGKLLWAGRHRHSRLFPRGCQLLHVVACLEPGSRKLLRASCRISQPRSFKIDATPPEGNPKRASKGERATERGSGWPNWQTGREQQLPERNYLGQTWQQGDAQLKCPSERGVNRHGAQLMPQTESEWERERAMQLGPQLSCFGSQRN